MNYFLAESLEEIDLYDKKSVNQLIREALKEDKKEQQENNSFEEIINKYATK